MCSAEAVQLAGTAVQAGSQIQAGREADDAARANAAMANAQAEAALRRGRWEERKHRREVSRLIGRQVASASAQGINVAQGSALDAQMQAAEFGELDAQQIRENAFMEASGYRMQASEYRRAGDAAKQGALMTGFGSLLSGYGSIYASKPGETPSLFGTPKTGTNGKKKPKPVPPGLSGSGVYSGGGYMAGLTG